jgi:hypothetical protein
MTYCFKIAIGIQLAGSLVFGQSRPHTYTGNIVNANCMQAEKIVNRNSRGYIPSAEANAFTGSRYKTLRTEGTKNSILKHCSLNPGVTAFALVNNQGNFFRLDETGNLKVLSQTEAGAKNIRAIVTGFVDRDTLNVDSLSIVGPGAESVGAAP